MVNLRHTAIAGILVEIYLLVLQVQPNGKDSVLVAIVNKGEPEYLVRVRRSRNRGLEFILVLQPTEGQGTGARQGVGAV